MKKTGVYFENLDSIRFIAALMVVFHHITPSAIDLLNLKGTWKELFLNVIFDGGVGVSIFFVLSGFLITYLLISEYELRSKISIRNFYIRRILRIWPLYFAVIAFSYGMIPIIKVLSPHGMYLYSPNFGYYLSFLSNFDILNRSQHELPVLLSQRVTWSVSIEEQFYLFWPLIFTLLNRKYWIYAIILVITGSVMFRILNYSDVVCLYYHTFSVLLDLGIGGLAAYLIKRYLLVKTFFEKTSTWTHLILFITTFFVLMLRPKFALFSYGNALSRIFISGMFAMIIASQALTTSKSKLNLHNLRFANKWGKYTYGIYLLHPIVIFIVENSLGLFHLKLLTLPIQILFIILSVVLTLFVSYLSYTYYESWFLNQKKRFEIVHTAR